MTRPSTVALRRSSLLFNIGSSNSSFPALALSAFKALLETMVLLPVRASGKTLYWIEKPTPDGATPEGISFVCACLVPIKSVYYTDNRPASGEERLSHLDHGHIRP